ncbi:uncharacterized protein LOC118803222 [Colossoma macropomum]|uniref:uncharacterized protein LOC118803222 n=1 Tax=Colossoma macropomum TaxID=42526 RepID=UPI0018656961|nr:uncharacterized protein LOC118803222 [Colossoma macropomum]
MTARIGSSDPNIFLPSTTAPIITTTTSITTVGQTVKGTFTPPQTLPTSVPSTYPVSLLVLGAVLFLALVLLVVLFYQNRVLRRVLSKRRRKTLTEAVYEEIDRRHITKRNDLTPQGSILSKEQHSGYEDVDEELLSGEPPKEDTEKSYDDVITAGQISKSVAGSILSKEQHSGYEDVDEELLSGEPPKEDTEKSYDDVITAGQISKSVAENVAENYDEVITADQSSAVVTALHMVCTGQHEVTAQTLLQPELMDTEDSTGTMARQLAKKPDITRVFESPEEIQP